MVSGNCGVGFAPVEPERREWLIGLMEGVEDIPGAALSDGIVWEWESFPEYLDAVDRKSLALDIGLLMPHGAVRSYVMGERGAKNEPATEDDIAEMGRLVAEGVRAGALGFSTSRTVAHMAIDGEPVPGTFAAEAELVGLGQALASTGRGVFEFAPAGALGEDLAAPDKEMAWMRRLAKSTGRPVIFGLTQNDAEPDGWKRMLELSGQSALDGAGVTPQVAARPVSLLLGLHTFHLFSYCRAWSECRAAAGARAGRPHEADPDYRARLLSEVGAMDPVLIQFLDPERVFPIGPDPDYEPDRADSVAAQRRAGHSPAEEFYDLLMEDDGEALLLRPLLNYSDYSLDPVREMLVHPTSVWGLGDGGAHCGTTCDASAPTYLLAHWARDRTGGTDPLPLEWVVKKMTHDTARTFGLTDRGTLEVGMLGDLNLVDHAGLQLHRPELAWDLPAGARRFIQKADGWKATVKRGQVTFLDGEDQGERPGPHPQPDPPQVFRAGWRQVTTSARGTSPTVFRADLATG